MREFLEQIAVAAANHMLANPQLAVDELQTKLLATMVIEIERLQGQVKMLQGRLANLENNSAVVAGAEKDAKAAKAKSKVEEE